VDKALWGSAWEPKMAERDGGGSREGETETEESTEDLGGTVGGGDVWGAVDAKLLYVNADGFLRKGILSFVVEVLAPLEE
jgi:hypothetical protein